MRCGPLLQKIALSGGTIASSVRLCAKMHLSPSPQQPRLSTCKQSLEVNVTRAESSWKGNGCYVVECSMAGLVFHSSLISLRSVVVRASGHLVGGSLVIS